MITNRQILLLYDLYWLRYKKQGDQWYELTDLIRNVLKKESIIISYDDKNKDIIFNGIHLTKLLKIGKYKKNKQE